MAGRLSRRVSLLVREIYLRVRGHLGDLPYELADREDDFGEGVWRQLVLWAEGRALLVVATRRRVEDLYHVSLELDQPNLPDSGSRVERDLVISVVARSAITDLDDEQSLFRTRMRFCVEVLSRQQR